MRRRLFVKRSCATPDYRLQVFLHVAMSRLDRIWWCVLTSGFLEATVWTWWRVQRLVLNLTPWTIPTIHLYPISRNCWQSTCSTLCFLPLVMVWCGHKGIVSACCYKWGFESADILCSLSFSNSTVSLYHTGAGENGCFHVPHLSDWFLLHLFGKD